MCLSMDYDGSNEFYRDEVRRARKAWRCCECREDIAAGQRYEYAVGKSGGDIFSARTCVACAEIREAFTCGSWIFGQLWKAIREDMFPRWNEMSAIDCLAKLTTDAAIAKMRAEYAEWKEDNEQ